jgi:hypothetical protein
MTELIITPNYDKKTARFKGTIAGGESVKVTIVGAAKWLSDSLRLRVVCGCSLTVAMFPLKSEDSTVSSFEVEGDNLIAAPLELNTIQARLHTQGLAATTATFIVEDVEKNILYFQDSYELHGWVKRDGDEEPYDLNKFPELIEDWRKQIESLIVDAKEVDGGIEVTICDGVSPAKTFIIRNGRDGQPGEPGRKGDDGKSLKFNDLTEAQKAELKGPKGDTGDGITDELKALPDKVTKNTQAIETNRVAVNTEEIRAKGAEKELLTRIEESKANAAAAMTAASKAQDTAYRTATEIATLVGADAGDKRKSARTIAAEEVAKVVANAPADLDTLKEIADYIESDKTGAAQMVTQIDANAKAISAEAARAEGAEAALGEAIAKKVDAEEGKGLSTEDYTTEEKDKLDGIEAGAQKNVAPVSPSYYGAGKPADAAEVYKGLSSVSLTADEANNRAFAIENYIIHTLLPRYQFDSTFVLDGVVTVAPYTNAKLESDGTAFTVSVGEGNNYVRDCVLVVECSNENAPTITWGDNFHPRTDAETDFKCEAGKRNVYWITEHSPNEFCVAGWQETAGGNAE